MGQYMVNKYLTEGKKMADERQIKLGDKVAELSDGHFLDPEGTFVWKFTQLARTVEYIRKTKPQEQLVVFLHDAWFPGVECLEYIRVMKERELRVYGFWHSGAYDTTDLLGRTSLHRSMAGSERTWGNCFNGHFVATEYSKLKLATTAPLDRVYVIGEPVQVGGVPYKFEFKERTVVWPHRLSLDKLEAMFDRLKFDALFEDKDIQFFKTQEWKFSRQKYYDLLSKSRVAVSTASHENFGIAMLEATMLGCTPIVPNRLAYKELYPECLRYDTYSELKELVKKYLDEPPPDELKPPEYYRKAFSPEVVCRRAISIMDGVKR